MVKSKHTKTITWIIAVILAVALLLFGGYWLLRLGFDTDILDRSGWQTSDEGVLYLDYNGKPLTGWSVAIPGHSEHQTGLALDFNRDEPGTLKWMSKHCWDYGFIVRYPEGKFNYTGIVYESWHFRYVGVELAQELKELDLCMEEYMQMLTEQEQAKDPPV